MKINKTFTANTIFFQIKQNIKKRKKERKQSFKLIRQENLFTNLLFSILYKNVFTKARL